MSANKGQKRVNIPRSVKDSHYRYTMPAIESKVEGSGNGIKTKIPNLSDIAKDLHREAADILKMFGFELGAVTIARDDVNSYIVNGKFSANELADVLDSFVEKFVLCGSCRNPETFIVPSKGQVKLRCISCGNETVCDAKNKLTDFILKDAQRRKLKAKQEATAASGDKKKSAKAKKKAPGDAAAAEDDDEDTEWSVDVSSAAVKARRRAALGMDDAPDGKEGGKGANPEEEFKQFIAGSEDIDQEKLRQLRDALRLSPGELAQRVCANLFTENIVKEIIPAKKRWAAFFGSNAKAQEALMQSVIDLSLVHEETVLNNLATVLKGLYDHDFLEEDAVLAWYDNVGDDAKLLKAKLKAGETSNYFGVCEYGLDEDTYSWDQDKESVFVTCPNIPKGLRGSDMDVKITRDSIKAGLKGQPPLVQGQLRYKINLDESTWGLDTDDNKLEMTLVKHIPQEVEYWPSLLVGGREIDVDLIEGSKYLDRSLLKKVKANKKAAAEAAAAGKGPVDVSELK